MSAEDIPQEACDRIAEQIEDLLERESRLAVRITWKGAEALWTRADICQFIHDYLDIEMADKQEG